MDGSGTRPTLGAVHRWWWCAPGWHDECVRVSVRVRPGASRTRVGGRWGDEEVLGVSVAARAVDGAATAAVFDAVAAAFGVQARDVTLVSGRRSRTKVLEVAIDDEVEGRATLHRLLAAT